MRLKHVRGPPRTLATSIGDVMYRPNNARAAIALALAAAATSAHASCGSAFCMVNTNWDVQGASVEPGLRMDFRFEYIKQDQPRTGTRNVGVGEIPRDHDEVNTYNRNYVGTLDYTLNERWGVTVTLPYVDRSHFHIHNDVDTGDRDPERWNFNRLGDMRVIGRYQFKSESREAQRLDFYGINFGVKLPTGPHDVFNANGDRAERTLQPGTGTTDAIIGAFYSGFAGTASWFAQTLWQVPLKNRDDYRPGNRLSLDVGYRYAATEKVGLLAQLNYLHRGRDSGGQAERTDSGGEFVFVSPGLSYAFTPGIQLYGFVQKPVYQRVNGVQLVSDWAAVVGVSSRF